MSRGTEGPAGPGAEAKAAARPLEFSFGEFRTTVSFPDTVDPAGIAARFPSGVVTVFDTTTHILFGSGAPNPVVLPAGERSKGWESVKAILSRMTALGLSRDSAVIGVGGGVVTDLAAFAASVYMRGCTLVLAPTTLLAMVDAAVGGKTGFDFEGYKNLVGTFYPAVRVEAAAGALRSLPEREYLGGLAEVVKSAVIRGEDLFSILESGRREVLARDPVVMAKVVRMCLEMKGAVVSEDLRERGRRAVLNLGHTFAHALESCTGFSTWSHGEAVAWGMKKAVETGLQTGITDPGFAARLISLLEAYGFPLSADVPAAELCAAMMMDKKRRGGETRLVIPRSAGDVEVVAVKEPLIARVLGG